MTTPISIPYRQEHTWVSSTTHGLGLFGTRSPYPIQWVEPQGWGHLRAIPGFGVFWFIPSLLAGPISSQPPLYRGFSPVYIHGVGMTLAQIRVVSYYWQLEGVKNWKLSRTYPGEKLPSSPYPRKDDVLPRASKHGTCWQYPPSQWE